jgi:hypothetical protein
MLAAPSQRGVSCPLESHRLIHRVDRMGSSQEFLTMAAARQLREMWERKTGDRLGAEWDRTFLDWARKSSFGLVADAIQRVAAPRYSDDGKRVPPNVDNVPAYAVALRADEAEPGMLDCYLVRGRMRKKFYCEENDDDVLALLRNVLRAGIPDMKCTERWKKIIRWKIALRRLASTGLSFA